MADAKSLVYSRRDDSGAAAVFPDRAPVTDRFVQAAKTTGKTDRNPDMALRSMMANMGKAWSVDYDELQQDFDSKVMPALMDYEREKNPGKKRDLWYNAQVEMGKLNNKISKSAKTERQFVQSYNAYKNDQSGAYDESAEKTFADYPTLKLDERPETPQAFRASKMDFFKYMVDNVKGHTEKITKNVRQDDGTYKNETKVYLDEKGLKEAIREKLTTAPQTYKNAFFAKDGQAQSAREEFLEKNPNAIYLPPEEQAKKFEDFVVDKIFNIKKEGYNLSDMKAISYDANDGSKYDLDFIGAAAETDRGIFTLHKVEDGLYKLGVTAKNKTAMDDKAMDWIVTGKEFKEQYPNLAEGVTDDMEMTVKGKLTYMQLDEKGNKQPVLGIKIEEVQKPNITGDATTLRPADLASMLFAKAVKKGEVINVGYNYENKAQFLKYGGDPDKLFRDLKAKADKQFKDDEKKSAELARQTKANPEKTTQSRGTDKPTGEKKSKASQELLDMFK